MTEQSIDEKIDLILGPVSDLITNFVFSSFNFFGENVPFIVCWLLFASLFFTIYFKFLNIRYFKRAIRLHLENMIMKVIPERLLIFSHSLLLCQVP